MVVCTNLDMAQRSDVLGVKHGRDQFAGQSVKSAIGCGHERWAVTGQDGLHRSGRKHLGKLAFAGSADDASGTSGTSTSRQPVSKFLAQRHNCVDRCIAQREPRREFGRPPLFDIVDRSKPFGARFGVDGVAKSPQRIGRHAIGWPGRPTTIGQHQSSGIDPCWLDMSDEIFCNHRCYHYSLFDGDGQTRSNIRNRAAATGEIHVTLRPLMSLAGRRFVRSPRRWVIAAAGIALSIAGLLVSLATPALASQAALRDELLALTPDQRTVTVVALDRADTDPPAVDSLVRQRLNASGLETVRRIVALRPLATPSNTIVRVVGVDTLETAVTVIDGRMPAACTAAQCEMVRWDPPTDDPARTGPSTGLPILLDPAWHSSIVGTVSRSDLRVLSGTFTPEPGETVLFVNGADGVNTIQALALIQRSTGWLADVDPTILDDGSIDQWLDGLAKIDAQTPLADLTVTAPEQTIRSIATSARITSNRLWLPIGQAWALLVGFSALTMLSVRTWHQRALKILRSRNAQPSHLALFSAIEAGCIVGAGATLGVAVGVPVVALLARRVGAAVTGPLIGWPNPVLYLALAIGGLWLLGWVLLRSGAATTTGNGVTPPVQRSTRPRVMVTDIVGAAALATWVFAAGRGRATASSLSASADPLITATPALAAIVVGCFAVRLVPIVLGVIGRCGVGNRWPLRVAASDGAGRAVRPLATCAFIAGALCLAIFAIGYRSTLRLGSVDQAAFQVPFDVTLRSGSALVRPQAVRPIGEWNAIDDVTATDVVRRGAGIRRSGTRTETVEVIGFDPTTGTQFDHWRSDFGDRSLFQAITTASTTVAGTAIPVGTSVITFTTSEPPPGLGISVVIARPDGTWRMDVAKPLAGSTDPLVWHAGLDPGDDGGLFVGWQIGQDPYAAERNEHAMGEGEGAVDAFTASVTLSNVRADDVSLDVPWSAMTSTTIDLQTKPAGVRVALTTQGTRGLLLQRQQVQLPLPAIVDPITAAGAVDGVLDLDTGSGTLSVRVAGTVNRFPTLDTRFVIVDGPSYGLALNMLQPGSGTANEQWIAFNGASRSSAGASMSGVEFRQLVVSDRVDIQSGLAGNTLGRSVVATFLVSALLAALLGALSMAFVIQADRLDEAPLLRMLRSEGASPRTLVGVLVTRAGALLVAAVPLGIVGGLLLLRAVRSLVQITASGAVPIPALRVSVPVWQLAALVATLVAVALLAAWSSARPTQFIRRQDSLLTGR